MRRKISCTLIALLMMFSASIMPASATAAEVISQEANVETYSSNIIAPRWTGISTASLGFLIENKYANAEITIVSYPGYIDQIDFTVSFQKLISGRWAEVTSWSATKYPTSYNATYFDKTYGPLSGGTYRYIMFASCKKNGVEIDYLNLSSSIKSC